MAPPIPTPPFHTFKYFYRQYVPTVFCSIAISPVAYHESFSSYSDIQRREKYRQVLESLCNQTMNRTEYELIVVDGNSKDTTRDIARKYADKVIIQTRAKVGGARNDGADLATADIIATTDGGDCVLPPEWVETVYAEFAAHPEAAAIYGTVYPLEDGIKTASISALPTPSHGLGITRSALLYPRM